MEAMRESGWFSGLGARLSSLQWSCRSRQGRVHCSSAIKSNDDALPMLTLKCELVHLASVSFQIWTLAVKHPVHRLPDVNALMPADASGKNQHEETNRLSLTDH